MCQHPHFQMIMLPLKFNEVMPTHKLQHIHYIFQRNLFFHNCYESQNVRCCLQTIHAHTNTTNVKMQLTKCIKQISIDFVVWRMLIKNVILIMTIGFGTGMSRKVFSWFYVDSIHHKCNRMVPFKVLTFIFICQL